MGNQQRSLDHRLCWLGGIVDGEGMITLIKRVGKRQKGYIPKISVVHTDPTLISEVISVCRDAGLPFYVQKKTGKGTWKTKYEVLSNGILRCRKVLSVLTEYLVSKREKALLLGEFCENRLSKPKGDEMSDREHQLARLIRNGHTTGPGSNTPRDYTPAVAVHAAMI